MLRFTRSDAPAAEKKARIVDGHGAKAWLAAMARPVTLQNLDEIALVLQQLGAQGADDGAPAAPPERKFAIAERIRGFLLRALSERYEADQFAFLPVDETFALHFWATVDAAAALRDVYAGLVSQLIETPTPTPPAGMPPPAVGPAAATPFVSGVGALHRALDVNAQLLIAIQRARWPVPPRLWERHCVLGQRVRDLDCQDVEVGDALRVSSTKTCRAAFVMPVLIALADPSARSPVEFEVVRMVAQRWSTKAGFRLERRADAATAPARPVANPGPTITLGQVVVRFDTQSALQSIDKRLDALADGKTASEVGIGDALRPQAARNLLMILKQRWGAVSPADVDSPDRTWRATPHGVQLVAIVGMPKSGQLYRDAASAGNGKHGHYAYQRIKAGGITRSREAIENERIEHLLASAETWTLDAESSDAVRCVRRYGRPRLGLQRLIGLRLGTPERDSPFLIGWVEALQGAAADRDDRQSHHSVGHTVRVRLAPGLPQLLHAAIDDVDVEWAVLLVPDRPAAAGRPRRVGAFVPMLGDAGPNAKHLPADDADDWKAVRASPRDYGLILPHSTYRPKRLVKAGRRGAVAVLRLEELMMRGSDFDLVRFMPL
ncbi:MAG: hypothetical protein ABI277_09410 [Burkholderiaceae bacterium]